MGDGNGAPRGGARRTTCVLTTLTVLAVSCGEQTAHAPPRPHAQASSAGGALGPLVAAAPPRDVPGAAPHVPTATVPTDMEPLGVRYAPRALPIPHVTAGRTASFTFDGDKPGWFARLPDGAQRLLTPPTAGRVYVGGGFSSTSVYALDAKSGRIDWATGAPDGGPTAALVDEGKML